jgi:hypothetical protein
LIAFNPDQDFEKYQNYSEQQKAQVDKEFYERSCFHLYDEGYKNRALGALE